MLAARALRFAHGSRTILDDATIVVDDADRAALVGDNGAGKSTLLAILAGLQKADDGGVERGRGQTLALLSQEPQLDPKLTAREVAESTGREPWEVDEALSRLGVVDADRPVSSLSGGQRRRVDLARTLLQAADILLLDEPTNHLDKAAIAWLVERLKTHRGPVIIVSHDRQFLDETCTRVIELSRGKLHGYAPPGDDNTTLTISFIEQKILRDDITVRTQHKKERLWIRELAWLRAGTPARTTKQTARIDRAGELQTFVEEEAVAIRKQKKNVEIDGVSSKRLGKSIFELNKVTIARGGRTLFKDLDLIVTKGQRWGVVGDNGAGKTSLLLALMTAAGDSTVLNEPGMQVTPTSGTITAGLNTKIAVFDQHRATLDPEMTLEQTLSAENDHVFVNEARIHVSSYLERFLFDGSDRRRRVKTLSGGEQNRLVFARLFLGDANVLLLDEPTNDLDVTTLGVLEEALVAHPGCAFLVSHDRRFLDRVATGILAFERAAPGHPDGPDGPATVTPVIGDWTHYERTQATRLQEAQLSTSATVASTSTAKIAGAGTVAKKKRSYKEEQEFAGIEALIAEKETRREHLRTQLIDPEVFKSDSKKSTAMAKELSALDVEIERLYARWQVLSDLPAM
ncbi:MAG: ABC-F family ATP-binding cassette domain-containing protein [Deltaproteobacteria bacterium]|nr:ABC-F family ATP-binding cassette domain-containing protein [Deltaproteobacteria bacterium]